MSGPQLLGGPNPRHREKKGVKTPKTNLDKLLGCCKGNCTLGETVGGWCVEIDDDQTRTMWGKSRLVFRSLPGRSLLGCIRGWPEDSLTKAKSIVNLSEGYVGDSLKIFVFYITGENRKSDKIIRRDGTGCAYEMARSSARINDKAMSVVPRLVGPLSACHQAPVVKKINELIKYISIEIGPKNPICLFRIPNKDSRIGQLVANTLYSNGGVWK